MTSFTVNGKPRDIPMNPCRPWMSYMNGHSSCLEYIDWWAYQLWASGFFHLSGQIPIRQVDEHRFSWFCIELREDGKRYPVWRVFRDER